MYHVNRNNFWPPARTGETTYFHFHINIELVPNLLVTELQEQDFHWRNQLHKLLSFSIKSPNYLIRINKRTYHTKVKLLNAIVRGEEVKIHISQNSRNMTYNNRTRTLETPILIVKFSNDVSFPVII